MSDVRPCKDCANYAGHLLIAGRDGESSGHQCGRLIEYFDYVNGDNALLPLYESCQKERESGECGPEGKFWEGK